MGPVKLLHVYNQEAHHDEVWIVGNVEGLLALRNAVDAALHKEEGVGQEEVMVSDGEGYSVCVVCEDSDWQAEKWTNLTLPYTADYAASPNCEGVLMPWEVGRWAAEPRIAP